MTEAIVLVGGQGTRLRPLTLTTAKPLLPTAGVPFLVHALSRLPAAGIRHVLLATSYRADTFTSALGDGSALGLELEYVVEEEALGTGGAIRYAGARLRGGPDDAVVILNGDVLSGADLGAQLAVHHDSGADVTLHLTHVADARAFGAVPTDETGRVTAFLEKMATPPTNWINAGCYVFRRRVVDAIPAGRPVSVERETFPGLLGTGAHVRGFLESTYWLDVGTPAAYVRGSCDLVLGRAPSAALQNPPGERLVAPDVTVPPSAVVGGGSTVGPGVQLGDGVRVESSVILAGAVLEAGAEVRDSVVGAGARVGEATHLEEVVVGDGAVVGSHNELRCGARVWTGVSLPDRSVRFSPDV